MAATAPTTVVPDALALRTTANNTRRAALLDTPNHPLRPLAVTLDDYHSLAARNHRWAQEAGTDTRNHDIYYTEATTFEIAAHLLTIAIDKALDNLENTTT